MIKTDSCPKCGGQKVKEGVVHSAAGAVHMLPKGNPRSTSSPVLSHYCSSCGYILEWYVEHPERLD
ncbi:acetyltransferase [Bacillus sp. SB49]|uniref:hypothetical protein n=1 Tax=Bacillus sp. SB49 TaxID=1071080 RepID=UPI000421A84E|nr:hypothetical protein [Bacillus sp. SB49]QHT47898.1 acetyltransferase [Bacillus sp. SB49]